MSAAFAAFAADCPHRLVFEVPRRPVNGLNVEIGRPSPRCKLRQPTNWGGRDMAARWLLSGGDGLVFGYCNQNVCPLKGV